MGKSCLLFEQDILADIKLSGQGVCWVFSSRVGAAAPSRFIDQVWPWVSSTRCPSLPAKAMLLCSWMQVGTPLPDVLHISGPELEGDKSIFSVHAKVNLPSVLSPLSSPDLSSPVPNVDTTASTPIAHRSTGPGEFLHSCFADI